MEDLDLILKFGKVKNYIGEYRSKDFIELSYGLVKIEIPALLSAGKLNECTDLILKNQYPKFEIKNHLQNDILSFVLWIREQLEFIFNLENAYLHSEPKPDLLASGINRLDEFGAMVVIDNLAGGDILKYEKIKALPYFEIYQKLKMDKIQAEIKEQYEKIMIEKSKRK